MRILPYLLACPRADWLSKAAIRGSSMGQASKACQMHPHRQARYLYQRISVCRPRRRGKSACIPGSDQDTLLRIVLGGMQPPTNVPCQNRRRSMRAALSPCLSCPMDTGEVGTLSRRANVRMLEQQSVLVSISISTSGWWGLSLRGVGSSSQCQQAGQRHAIHSLPVNIQVSLTWPDPISGRQNSSQTHRFSAILIPAACRYASMQGKQQWENFGL